MELIFLGTGPTEPVRRPERRSERTNSSILLREPDTEDSKQNTDNSRQQKTSILFDCTPNFTEQINREKINPEEIRYVFISHGHMDAIGGLPQLLKRNKDFTIYCSEKTKDRILEEFKSLEQADFKILKHGEAVDVNNIRITPFKVVHAEAFPTGKKFPAFGFRIEFYSSSES